MDDIEPKLYSERAKHRPSERNQLIFREVRVLGHSQAGVAQRFGVSQVRVSQICRQVDRWQAWVAAHRRPPADQAQQERLNLLADRERCERIYLAAVGRILRSEERLITERTRVRNGQAVKDARCGMNCPAYSG